MSNVHNPNDQDTSKLAGHHSIGTSNLQGAAGDHTHDGENSVAILEYTITGSRTDGTALTNILAALGALGITDSTTP